MSLVDKFILLAEYNKLMNQRQYAAVARLSRDEITCDRGAFFKSILGTLNHIMVGDILWLNRFGQNSSNSKLLSYILEKELPKSLDELLFEDFGSLKAEREKIDSVITEWIRNLSDNAMDECITYTSISKEGKIFNKKYSSLIHHMFLHQVHHRGQVTTLLYQSGMDFGETDIIEIIDECDI